MTWNSGLHFPGPSFTVKGILGVLGTNTLGLLRSPSVGHSEKLM